MADAVGNVTKKAPKLGGGSGGGPSSNLTETIEKTAGQVTGAGGSEVDLEEDTEDMDKAMTAPKNQQGQQQQQQQQQEGGGRSRRQGRHRMVPVHQSRIADREKLEEDEKSSLRIKIELDLEVEVELYARVKGDVTIGLL